jgi:hypothetical protein
MFCLFVLHFYSFLCICLYFSVFDGVMTYVFGQTSGLLIFSKHPIFSFEEKRWYRVDDFGTGTLSSFSMSLSRSLFLSGSFSQALSLRLCHFHP